MSTASAADWLDLNGNLSAEACRALVERVASHCSVEPGAAVRLAVIGVGSGRAAIGLSTELRKNGYEPQIKVRARSASPTDADRAEIDALQVNTESFGVGDAIQVIWSRRLDSSEYARDRYDFVYIDCGGGYDTILANAMVAIRSAKPRCLIAGDGIDQSDVSTAVSELFGADRIEEIAGHWVVRIDESNHPDYRSLSAG